MVSASAFAGFVERLHTEEQQQEQPRSHRQEQQDVAQHAMAGREDRHRLRGGQKAWAHWSWAAGGVFEVWNVDLQALDPFLDLFFRHPQLIRRALQIAPVTLEGAADEGALVSLELLRQRVAPARRSAAGFPIQNRASFRAGFPRWFRG